MQVDETGSALQDLTYNWWGDNLKSLGLKRSLTEVKLCAMKRRGWSVLQEWISSNITEENKSLITGHWNDSELNRCISTYLILTTALVGHDLATKPNSVCGGLVAKSCPTLCNPMDCSPSGSSVHGIFWGKNTGVGCHFLLLGIFLTQRSNIWTHASCTEGGFFTVEPPEKSWNSVYCLLFITEEIRAQKD